MKKILNHFLALIIISASAFAQNAVQPIPFDPSVRTGKLPNGMTYYIKKNTKPEKRAELRLAVNVGATMENDDQQGLAHFTEHMAFNGTKNFKKNELVDYLESAGVKFGAHLNAYTSFDETVYMLQLPTDSEKIFMKGFQVLEDWAHNLSFDPEEIEKERGVVISERRLGLGAFERMREKYWPIYFKDSRYAERLPIGKLDVLEKFKPETLKQFYYDWYRPELMAVIAIGDFDVDKIEKLIKEKFSAIPQKSNPRPLQSFPVPDNKELLIAKATDKEAPYTLVEILYKHPKEVAKTLSEYRKYILYDLFSGMLNKRLEELQKQANPPFLFSQSSISGLVRTKDGFTSFAVVNDKGIEKGIEALTTENERVKKFGFTKGELDREKKTLMRTKEKELKEKDKTESARLAGQFVSRFLENEPLPGIDYEYDFYKQNIAGISLEELNKVAKEWITDNGENTVVLVQAPEKESVVLPSDDKIRSIFKDLQTKNIKPYEDKVIDKPLMTVKPTPSKVVEEKQNKEMGITEWKLANGVRVFLKPTDFKNDEVSFNAFSYGGTSQYPDKDDVSASYAASIVKECGLGEFDKISLGKVLNGKIASVSPYIDELKEGMSGKASPQDIETLFQLIYLNFTQPRKDEVAFQAFMEQQKGFIENRSADPESAFEDTVEVTMSQYHFRHRPMTLNILKEINLDRAFEIYKDRFADASDFTFTFVGNLKPEEIKPLVETYLGGLPSINRKESWKDVGVATPKGVVAKTVKRGQEPKSNVMLIFTGPFQFNRKNRMDMQSFSKLLNIKLRESLREDKSGTYGVGAYGSPSHYPKEAYQFYIQFGCAPEKVDELLAAAIKEVDLIKQNGANEKDLQKVKETLLREREVYLKENSFWLNAISSNYQNNENILEILEFNKYVEALTSDDFKRLANQYFNMGNYAKFLLMPEK
jgi:zinc protease